MTAPKLSALLARYRLHLSFLVFVVLVLEWQLNDGGRPYPLFSPRDLNAPLGLLLTAAGLGLRSWAAGVIHKRVALATEGPYSLIRHPLYLGSFLVALGFAEIMDDLLALAVILLAVPLIYVSTIQQEERGLAEKFGAAWDAYAACTGSILPRLPVRLSPGDWSWERWWANREWRILLRTVAVLWLLEWWNTLAQGG